MHPYFEKYAFRHHPIILEEIDDALGIIVVIPCYNEVNLLASLNALSKCNPPCCSVEVIIVINAAENEEENVLKQNSLTKQEVEKWTKENSFNWCKYFILEENALPQKHAGVGLARKIGMDEAAYRLLQSKNEQQLIVCFDADSLCESNYLEAIDQHFKVNLKSSSCSVHFEHPIDDSDICDEEIIRHIISYELHLRYYKQAIAYAQLPFAYHTIGSSMAVRMENYLAQGGMNKRKAGEDFYFLQKFIELGNHTELNTTTVIPSPRPSNRVPFGTGKAVQDMLSAEDENLFTYNPQSFEDLRQFATLIKVHKTAFSRQHFVSLSSILKEFLLQNDFWNKLNEVIINSNEITFLSRFYKWFNAFKTLKFVHYARDNVYHNITVKKAAKKLLDNNDIEHTYETEKDLLLLYRELDKINH